MRLQEKAVLLSKEMFVGGPVKYFEKVGRLQLATLLNEGLYPNSKVLDIGCGCLRGGYWLIHFLNPNSYFGIEPNREMLEAGIKELLEPGLLEEKKPRFDHNADFDTSVFGEKFDFFVARSVWTHAAKNQIRRMLDSFSRDSTDNAAFLTSYLRAGLFRNRDYQGALWIGRSHVSNTRGLVYHRFDWIKGECAQRGLVVVELKEGVFNRQIWLRITKKR